MSADTELVSLAALANLIVKSGQAPTCAPCTVFRWSRYGVRGHRLAVRLVGGRIFTTWADYLDFAERLKSGRSPATDATQTHTSTRTARRIHNAEKVLEAAGI